jgi:polar amino acid transport system substrate-binding protein
LDIDPSLAREFAPGGRLRAALNMGNPVLAHSQTASERPAGVSIDLAREFARRLGVAVDFTEFDTPGHALEAIAGGAADIGFLAVDPERAQSLHFTPHYVEIEGSYLVPQDSPIQRTEEVDVAGMQVVVGVASAYDLFLKRHLKHAGIVRVPVSEAVVDAMLQQSLPVAAGVRQQLEHDARRLGGVRLLPGNFMVIRQAMVTARGRSEAARQGLDRFIGDMRRSGFVREALSRHGIAGARAVD